MELREYWLILRRWLWLVILGTLLAAVAAYVVSRNTEPVYQSTVTMRVDPSTGRLTNEYAGLLVAEQLAGTYSQQMKMRPVMAATLEELGLQGQMTPAQLGGLVSVSPVRDTQLIRLSVEHTDSELAAGIANKVAAVFIRQNQQFEQGRYAASKQSLSEELSKTRLDLENTQAAIDLLTIPEDQFELDALNLILSSQRAAYANMLSNYEELRIAEASESSNVLVVEQAVPSYGPIRPRTMQNTMLAAAVGAMLAVGVIFLVEYLDDTVKTPDDVSATAGLSTLGAIAQFEGKVAQRLITLISPRSPISEAFRALRTNIQFAAVDGPLSSMMITSPGPGEGKSTVISNLAVVMAQAGRRVILVDADLRRPKQHRFFELPNGQGLTTALLDLRTPAIEHVQTTGVPGLRVMTSGPIPPNPAELLGSQRQADLLAELAGEANIVMLDTPPVLTVTDALVLAPLTGGVMLVVEVGATRRDGLQKAMEALSHSGGRVLGVALNQLSARRSGYYYYQYYQYYYSRYEKEGTGSTQRRGILSALLRR